MLTVNASKTKESVLNNITFILGVFSEKLDFLSDEHIL